MQTITTPTTTAPQPEGMIVTSALTGGRIITNHSEGIAVRSNVKAGGIIAPQ